MGGSTQPTFTYQSAYTNQTLKYDGKAYGTAEFAQVPVYEAKKSNDEDEFEVLETKLDIELSTLKAELLGASQDKDQY